MEVTRGEGTESLEPTDDEEGFLLPVVRGREKGEEEKVGRVVIQDSGTIFNSYGIC